jgi:O-antigen/teichoic acid export membrane protein
MERRRFLQQSTFLIFSKIVHYATVFFTGVVLTRSLSKGEYGTFSQVVLLSTALSLIIGTWLSKSLYYFLPTSSQKKQIMLQTYLVLLGLGCIGGLLMWLLRVQIGLWFGNPALPMLAVYIALFMLMLTFYLLTDPFFISVEKAHVLAATNIVFSIVYMVVLSYFLLRGVTLSQLVTIIVLLYLALILFVLANILKLPGPLNSLFNIEFLGRQTRYAAPLLMSSIVVVLGYQIDKYIIATTYSTTDFAVYYRGAIELPLIEIITFTIYNMLLPRFVQFYQADRKEDFLRVWHEAIKKTVILLFPIFVLFFFLSQRFITTLYTERYAASAPVFRIYLLIIVIQVVSWDTILQATGKTREIFYASSLKLVSSLMVSLLLIRFLGPVGAAIGLVFGHVVATFYYLSRIRRIFHLSFAKIFPWTHIFRVLMLSLGLGALTYTISFFGLIDSKLAFMGVYGAIFSSLYIVLIFKLKFLRLQDLEFLKLSFFSDTR